MAGLPYHWWKMDPLEVKEKGYTAYGLGLGFYSRKEREEFVRMLKLAKKNKAGAYAGIRDLTEGRESDKAK